MSHMGYGHWTLVGLTAFILLLMEWRDGNVARNPYIVAVAMICAGIAIAFLDGDFKEIRFIEFMLFMNVDFASTTIAIGYSFVVFGLISPIISTLKKKRTEKKIGADAK